MAAVVSLRVCNIANASEDKELSTARQARFAPEQGSIKLDVASHMAMHNGQNENLPVTNTDKPRMDKFLIFADSALRTVFSSPSASRPAPTPMSTQGTLDAREKQLSAALMRVNHVGEVCAQALYTGQAAATRNEALRSQLEHAAKEETDHLAWTRQRLEELDSRPSLLNPLWYAGAFALGFVAGRVSDRASLGFVVETERQVEAHLQGHLTRLPANDHASRAIVAQMKEDETRHADQAQEAGAIDLPTPVKAAMKAAAKVMTTTAHYI